MTKASSHDTTLIIFSDVDGSELLTAIVTKLILENMNIGLSPSTVHRLLQRLKFSYITPRPKHYKQNEKLKNEFKKKSSN